eukprot:1696905-Rhodomonas_salina.1
MGGAARDGVTQRRGARRGRRREARQRERGDVAPAGGEWCSAFGEGDAASRARQEKEAMGRA